MRFLSTPISTGTVFDLIQTLPQLQKLSVLSYPPHPPSAIYLVPLQSESPQALHFLLPLGMQSKWRERAPAVYLTRELQLQLAGEGVLAVMIPGEFHK